MSRRIRVQLLILKVSPWKAKTNPRLKSHSPRDRLELLVTTRRTYLTRLRSDLMRIEDELKWCQRYMPDGKPLEGDEEAAALLRQLIAVKERCLASFETVLAG